MRILGSREMTYARETTMSPLEKEYFEEIGAKRQKEIKSYL